MREPTLLESAVAAPQASVGGKSPYTDLAEVAAAQVCEAQAIAQAVRAVNSPRLAATHSAHQRQG